MTVTRFQPFLQSGHLHVGHILNALVNCLYAKQQSGTFYFAPEAAALHAIRTVPCLAENLRVADAFALLSANATMPLVAAEGQSLQTAYLDKVARQAFRWENPPTGAALHAEPGLLPVINDFVIDTTDIIRGKDWDPESPSVQSGTRLQGWTKHVLLNALRAEHGLPPVREHHHALLVHKDDTRGQKLSKSVMRLQGQHEDADLFRSTVLHTHEADAARVLSLTVVVYVLGLLGIEVESVPDLWQCHESFDMDAACGPETLIYDPAALRRLDQRVREMLCGHYDVAWHDAVGMATRSRDALVQLFHTDIGSRAHLQNQPSHPLRPRGN